MEIKPKYISFKRRIFQVSFRVLFGFVLFFLIFVIRKPDILGLIIFLIVIIPVAIGYLFTVINTCKFYITKIRIDDNTVEVSVNKYDKYLKTYKLQLKETRIKIVMLLFPFTHIGISYKLVVENKKGIKYHRLIQQFEIGDWHLNKFKEILESYGKNKNVPVSPQFYKRTMWF